MTRKIVDYILVATDDLVEFVDDVQENIANGYQPWGSIFVDVNYQYSQAMVKYEEEKDVGIGRCGRIGCKSSHCEC